MNNEEFFFDIPRSESLKAVISGDVYSSPETLSENTVKADDRKTHTYIMWGDDNQLPYVVKDLIEKNSVMAQNKLFNTLTCYGRGLEYMDVST